MVDLDNQVVDRRHLVLVNCLGGQIPLAQQATHIRAETHHEIHVQIQLPDRNLPVIDPCHLNHPYSVCSSEIEYSACYIL